MMVNPQALRHHADSVSDASLVRVEGRLRMLDPDERRAVEETARAIGHGIAECLLEHASSDECLAAVLSALYPSSGNGSGPG
jgi:hypothetical protein